MVFYNFLLVFIQCLIFPATKLKWTTLLLLTLSTFCGTCCSALDTSSLEQRSPGRLGVFITMLVIATFLTTLILIMLVMWVCTSNECSVCTANCIDFLVQIISKEPFRFCRYIFCQWLLPFFYLLLK